MTTIVMAAENSPPWKACDINISSPKQTLHTWLDLVDDPTAQIMYDKSQQALQQMLQAQETDHRLFKTLVSMGKQLYNNIRE